MLLAEIRGLFINTVGEEVITKRNTAVEGQIPAVSAKGALKGIHSLRIDVTCYLCGIDVWNYLKK